MCLAANKTCGKALEFVPSKIKNKEFCLLVIEENILDGSMLEFIPSDIINEEICLTVIKKFGYALKFVPAKFINKEMCLIAVSSDGSALEFVPLDILDMELCLIAINDKNSYATLQYVPRKFQTQELINIALDISKYNKDYIKKSIKCEIIIDNTEDCSICLSNEGEQCKLLCSHIFHTYCIYSWLDKSDNNKCPYCRNPIEFGE